MRKSYYNEGFNIAWGFDKLNGIFVQVFNKEDELVLDFDQSIVLTGMPFSSKISRNKMIEVLSQYSQEALTDFYKFEKESLSDTLKGYIQDENGRYDDYEILKTYGDWFKFFDKVEKRFTLTDAFDLLVAQR